MTTATLTLLHDTSPHGTGLFYVSVTIGGADFDLGTYDDLRKAAQRMGDWVRQRGMHWAPGSYETLAHVHATDGPVLTLTARTLHPHTH